jgi:hypothetical protein
VHPVPFGTCVLEHFPVVGSQVPAVVHGPLAVHVTAVPPQAPPVHVSFVVHAFPSLHAVPSGAVEVEHVPVVGLQVAATWHGSEAVQTTGLLPVQTPLAHA